MADMTAAQWATLVLQDLGAPTSQNNIDNMLAWMASENAWPPPRNNPLNNGLGSGGGSGLGSYPDLQTAASYAAKGMQGGITGAAGIGEALVNNAPFQTFHEATISATWSGDHYAGTDWASATSPSAMGVNGASAASNMTQADWQGLYAAGQQGGTSYLEAAASAAPGASQTAAASGSSASNTDFTVPGYGNVSATGQQATALTTIEATLGAYGFNQQQIAQLTQWAWGEITNNVDPTQIALDLQTPGTTGYQVFEQVYPGFVSANAQLNAQGLPSLSVAAYAQYQTTAQAMAQAAGLPPGTINSQNVGTLIGGNVSSTELSARLTDAVTLAYQSTPGQVQQFNEYFGSKYGDSGQGGLTAGQIAALALDPTVAEPLIAQQIKSAQIGGASVTSGVGALDVNTATELATAGITPAQATSTFQNIAPLSALETARPGMGGEAAQGTISANQLALGNLLGNPADQRQQQTALEVAKAPFTGGGGYVATSHGTGVGSANPNGTGNT
jgi:hypothetical protein